MKETLSLLLYIALITMFLSSPFISIWSMNTLFGLGIVYTLKTWCAMVWINLTILGGFNRWASQRNN